MVEPLAIESDPELLQSRAAEDGFWLSADQAQPGAIIEYTYFINGERHTEQVRFQPGAQGQFIYTGGSPADISVEIVKPSGDDDSRRQPDIELEAQERPAGDSVPSTGEGIGLSNVDDSAKKPEIELEAPETSIGDAPPVSDFPPAY